MSGTTISTPNSSDSGNIRPASITMMSSPQRRAMQFIPNSPRPPRGIKWSFPAGISELLMLSKNRAKHWGEAKERKKGRNLSACRRTFLRLDAIQSQGDGEAEDRVGKGFQPCDLAGTPAEVLFTRNQVVSCSEVHCAIASITAGDGASFPSSPSQRAITAVARQIGRAHDRKSTRLNSSHANSS